MKKFFKIMVLVAVCSNTGCMTHYANFRTLQSGQSIAPDGGRVTYSKVESYSYDSGYREYYRYDPNSLPAYTPVEVTTYRIASPLPHWHNIPNPIQGDRYEGHRGRHDGGHHGGNNGSPVYVTPAPNVRGLIP